MLAEMPVGQQQGMVQVGALVPHRIEPDQLLDLHHLGMPTERDELQFVASETAGDERMQRQGCPFHRHPAAVHGHGE